MEEPEPTRDSLKHLAWHTGHRVALVGDFYDVAEELAKGYAYRSPHAEPSGGSSPSVEASANRHYIELQMIALAELSSVCQSVLAWRVDDAREALMSWQEIADILEISKQAAHKRYCRREDITEYPQV